MLALIRRPGSGQVVHDAQPHGVSSLRLGCGRLLLKRGVRVLEGEDAEVPPGTTRCEKCKAAAS